VPTVQLWLSSDENRVVIQVWDANEQMPQRRELDLEAASGRGLTIVEAVSETLGAYRLEEANGKVVWALVRAE
jgi:two-component sensor histidine kinase